MSWYWHAFDTDTIKPVMRSSTADPANHLDARPCSVELVSNSQEALVEDEKKDYLYAVVDKANKKKRPPQVNITGMLVLFGCLCCFLLFLKLLLAILIRKDLCSLLTSPLQLLFHVV